MYFPDQSLDKVVGYRHEWPVLAKESSAGNEDREELVLGERCLAQFEGRLGVGMMDYYFKLENILKKDCVTYQEDVKVIP